MPPTATAAPSRSAARSGAIASAVMNGVSPKTTRTSSAPASMAKRAAFTASAVPRCFAWMCTEAPEACASTTLAIVLVPRPDHDRDAVYFGLLQRLQHMRDHREPADLVQDLRHARLHPLALSRRQHHREARPHPRIPHPPSAGVRIAALPGPVRCVSAKARRRKLNPRVWPNSMDFRALRAGDAAGDRDRAAVLLDQRRDRPLRGRRRGTVDARLPALDDGVPHPRALRGRPASGRISPASGSRAGQIALLGFLGMFVCGGIVYLALHHTTAANATLIYTASNVMILDLRVAVPRPADRRCARSSGPRWRSSGVAVVALGSEGWRLALNPATR